VVVAAAWVVVLVVAVEPRQEAAAVSISFRSIKAEPSGAMSAAVAVAVTVAVITECGALATMPLFPIP